MDAFNIAGFQGRSFRPLSHLSIFILPGRKAAATVLHLIGETCCGGLADKFGSFLAALLLQ